MLKKIIIIFAMASSATLAKADPHYCEKVGNLAEWVMKARQSNMPMSQIMKEVGDDGLALAIVRDAYSVPRFLSSEWIDNAIMDFRNDAELVCYNSRKNN